MNFWIAIAFGTGISAWVYNKAGRRLGYADKQGVFKIVAVIFVLSSLFFYTILRFVIPN